MLKIKKKLYFKKIIIKNIDNFIYKEFLLYNKSFCNMYINWYKHICWKYKKKNATKRK
jgi:hypothetical protein